jgi:toxin HigB-1
MDTRGVTINSTSLRSSQGTPFAVCRRRFNSAPAKLLAIDAAKQLDDPRVPPGNRLEMRRGDRGGQSSVRINDQWRICFVWRDGETWDVEIVDYH